MALVTIRGTLLPLLQYSEQEFDPQRGWIYRYHFRGASQFLMQAQQADFVRFGIACRLRFEQGDTASLEVEDSTQQFTLDYWEIVGNEESRDVFTHPTMLELCTDTEIGQLREKLANNASTEEVAAFLVGLGFGDEDGGTVVDFYGLALRGSSEYRNAQYVLRHTTNAPNRWAANISDVGVNQIYTPAQLLTEVLDSSLWVVPMPGRLVFKLSAIPSPTPVSGYQWGWLKGPGTESTAANNRVNIVTEYTLEQWSTVDYEPF